jgi:hypothetical protein
MTIAYSTGWRSRFQVLPCPRDHASDDAVSVEVNAIAIGTSRAASAKQAVGIGAPPEFARRDD